MGKVKEFYCGDYTRFSDYKPSAFDSTGVGSNGYENWLVMPVTINRDSRILEVSNWSTWVKGMPTTEGNGWMIHRFGHWACGWFEILTVSPTAKATLSYCDDCAAALSDYCVLDEDDLLQRESAAELENWDLYGRADYLSELKIEPQGMPDNVVDDLAWGVMTIIDGSPEYDGNSTTFPVKELAAATALSDYIAYCAADDIAEYVGTSAALEIASAIDAGPLLLAQYCERLPQYAAKATTDHINSTLALRSELEGLAL